MKMKRKLIVVLLVIIMLIPQGVYGTSVDSMDEPIVTTRNLPFHQGDVDVIRNLIANNAFFWGGDNPEWWPVTWTAIEGVYRITEIGTWSILPESVHGHVDVSGLTELRILRLRDGMFGWGALPTININGLRNLTTLELEWIELANVDFRQFSNLVSLNLIVRQAMVANLNGLNQLTELQIFFAGGWNRLSGVSGVFFPNGNQLTTSLLAHPYDNMAFSIHKKISLNEVSITSHCNWRGTPSFAPIWEVSAGATLQDVSECGSLQEIIMTVPNQNVSLVGSIAYNGATIHSYGDYYYAELADGTLAIVGHNRSTSNLVIPGTINGRTVSTIGRAAFWTPWFAGPGPGALATVTIPYTITEIRPIAFA